MVTTNLLIFNGVITVKLSEILFIRVNDFSSPGVVPQSMGTFSVISPGGMKEKLVDFSFCMYDFEDY